MKFRDCLILLLMFTVLLFPMRKTNAIESTTFDAIDNFVENNVMKKYLMTPGTSLAIVQNNESIYVKGYGKASKKIQMAIDTPMILGSISKSFTGLAIMQLNESGLLNLEDKIVKHIPWFTTKNNTAATEITIRHLLHHVSGFYRERSSEVNQTLKEIVQECLQDNLKTSPGSSYRYMNINYQILGYLIEVVSNNSYNEYIQQNIFNPLNMTNSYLKESTAKANGLAQGYISYFGVPIPRNPFHPMSWNPSSNIISSAEDMSHYMIALLNNGTYQNSSILTPKSINILFAHSKDFQNAINYPGYAVGWKNETINGVNFISHSGRAKNFLSEVFMAPEEGFGVVILHNVYSDFSQLYRCELGALNIMNILLGSEVEPKHKISFRVFYIGIDILFIVIILLANVIPLSFTNKRFSKLFDSEKSNKKKLTIGLFITMPYFLLSIILLFIIPGILGLLLGGIWVWVWMPEILLVPDLMTFIICWAVLSLVVGIFRVTILTKK